MSIEIINIPDLGEVEEVEVIEISVDVGQEVDNEDTIIVLESDKAAMEIPASKQGKISKLLVNIGDKVTEGMPFLEIETQDGEKEISSQDKSKTIEEKNEENVDNHVKALSVNHLQWVVLNLTSSKDIKLSSDDFIKLREHANTLTEADPTGLVGKLKRAGSLEDLQKLVN